MTAPYYDDGLLTVYHGDAREILPELPKVGLVLTDPPYAIGAGRGEWSATAAVAIGLHEAAKRVEKGGALLAFTTTSGRGIEFTQGAIGGRLPFNRLLTWSKTDGRSRALSPWEWDSVAILAFGSAPKGRSGQSSVFTTPAVYERPTGHPAELPDGISEWLYAPFDREDLVVLDPFMGAGRLLDAAIQRGRRAIGIEIEERYCEAAVRRLTSLSPSDREVDGAKERIAARSEYPVEPKQAALIADVLREAREQGLLVYQHERIHYCSVCGWSGDYARYKSGPRRGEKNYDRPLMRPAVEFARRFVRFKNSVSVGACGECIEVILPHLKDALVGVECQLPHQLHTEGEPEYIRHGRRRCTECSWEGHEGEMGRRPAVFGGTYPGKCPSCGAESRPFGPRVFEIIDGFDVVERKS